MARVKKHLTRQEEFGIMKLVLDKFLWLGVLIMGYGFYLTIAQVEEFWQGFTILLGGVVLLMIFMLLLVKEFNYAKG